MFQGGGVAGDAVDGDRRAGDKLMGSGRRDDNGINAAGFQGGSDGARVGRPHDIDAHLLVGERRREIERAGGSTGAGVGIADGGGGIVNQQREGQGRLNCAGRNRHVLIDRMRTGVG